MQKKQTVTLWKMWGNKLKSMLYRILCIIIVVTLHNSIYIHVIYEDLYEKHRDF